MIEIMENLPENVVGFSAKGHVTADDYESVIIPLVETKLEKFDKIRLLYHLGDEFKGFDAGALWDDAKVGLSHLTAWECIAVVSDSDWIRTATKVFGFAMPCPVGVFENAQLNLAKQWLIDFSL